MSKRLYVGNLSFKTTADGLRDAFSEFGEVVSATVVSDRETGRSRGFGFVEMAEAADADAAIEAMNGAELMGFRMVVKEAEERPRAQRTGGDQRPGRRPESSGDRPRSPRGSDGAEFSRQSGTPEAPQRDFRKKPSPKKGGKPKGQRDIYADGPKPSKLKKSKPKNTDWLNDLDDY